MLALLIVAVSGAWADDGDALRGVFTISSGAERAYFSKGNLQNGSFKFADKQWDVFGSSQSNGHRDLFGWGSANNPDLTIEDNNYYSTFTDWGTKIGDGTTWRTLTNDEWNYVLNTRAASTLNGKENARYAYATVSGVGGLILFPDNYVHPGDVTKPRGINTPSTAFDANIYHDDDWNVMESAGAVFLPHGGWRTGNTHKSDQTNYWSSTPSSTADQACGLKISGMLFASWWRYRGCSVRLVKSAGVTADGAVGGEFTVNASGAKVQFSKGNLQWVTSWKLADHQWDYVSQYNGDLFSWSSSGWGSQIGEGWRALSDTEWQCLLLNRKVIVGGESKASYGMGNVEGKNGLIILPDNWDGSVHSGFAYGADTWANVYSSSSSPTWAQMEAAGCVFLPAAGYYYNNALNQSGSRGYYWSTTSGNGLSFLENNFNPYSHDPTSLGANVRLVRMVDTPDDDLPTDGDGATLIASKADWEVFCRSVNAGNNYSGKTVKLTQDISVTTMVGTESNRFKGTFDGGGHTLTFNYTGSTNPVAPFSYTEGSVIQNLNVAGTINTKKNQAAGFVGFSYGTGKISNCRSSIVIKSDFNGDAGHGGFVAWVKDYANLTIEGCVYDGKILTVGTNATVNCAGFAGYKSDNATLTMTDCLYSPAALTEGETAVSSGCKTFACNNNSFTNCYYTRTLGDAQGSQVYSITAGTDVTSLAVSGTPTKSYDVSGLNFYSTAISSNGDCFAASGQDVPLALSHSDKEGYTFKQYTVTGGGTLANPETDEPTLTMTAANQTVSATYEPTYTVSLNKTGLADGEPALWSAKSTNVTTAVNLGEADLEGVKKSETVTVTYSGTKKIIGVKAEKKSATKKLKLTGGYFSNGRLVTKSLEIEYTDNDTWKDIAERYDEVSLVDNINGPEGKVVTFWRDNSQGINGCQLKSNESTYENKLVSINDKVSAYSSYYLQ